MKGWVCSVGFLFALVLLAVLFSCTSESDDSSNEVSSEDDDDAGDAFADDDDAGTDDNDKDDDDDAVDDDATADDDDDAACDPQLLFSDDFDHHAPWLPPGGQWWDYHSVFVFPWFGCHSPGSLRMLGHNVKGKDMFTWYTPIKHPFPQSPCSGVWIETWVYHISEDDHFQVCLVLDDNGDDEENLSCTFGHYSVNAMEWIHYAVRVDQEMRSYSFYINGEKKAGDSFDEREITDFMFLASGWTSYELVFSPGLLVDDVRIYDDGWTQ